ncbi:hypothetical protein V5O48_009556 [Marasmius crinis-equi]|uniref:MYND-type domain-containing protein n=1 Tax=Marasmius crinis-equi TaxID=585013 RepID=A0ABR3FBH2_9AGAR
MSQTTRFDTCCRCNRPSPQLQRCSKCKITFYCGSACQTAAWKSHKKICRDPPASLSFSPPASPEGIQGIRLIGGYNAPFLPDKPKLVPADHPVWTRGSVAPISQIVGVPLLIWRELEELGLDVRNDPNRDNQAVTFLMIDPESGFAPARWQKNVGPVTIVRGDHNPLTLVALEMIWMFCDRILDIIGEQTGTPLKMYTREVFNEFCQSYKEQYIQYPSRRTEMEAQELPL